MNSIFISYRRSDTAMVAGRMYDRLVAKYGRGSVFKDVDDIPPGADFLTYLRTVLGESAVVLVVIGPTWLTERDQNGHRRLDDPNDYVRAEVEAAFAFGRPVIPVLVDGARMPTPDELPAPLQAITWIQAADLRNEPYFKSDMDVLLNEVARVLQPAKGLSRWFSRAFGQDDAKLQSFRSPSSKDSQSPSQAYAGQSQQNQGGNLTPSANTSRSITFLETDLEQPARATRLAPRGLFDIFISYKRTDRPFVADLALRLAEFGYSTWFDQQLIGGQSWWDEILQHIRAGRAFIFVLTPESLESLPCQREYGYAHALLKRILPVQLADGVDLRLLPPALQKIQVVDYRTPDDENWTRLLSALGNLPPGGPLPDTLPPPPPAPISPLGAIKEQMDQPVMSIQDQAYIVHELRSLLRGPTDADGAKQLLRQFYYHPDLRKSIADEIQTLMD